MIGMNTGNASAAESPFGGIKVCDEVSFKFHALMTMAGIRIWEGIRQRCGCC